MKVSSFEVFFIVTVLFLTVKCQRSENINEHETSISSNIDRFSAKLINQLSTSYYHKNFVFSPFSIYSTLSLIGRGASNSTLKQIEYFLNTKDFEKTLNFSKEILDQNNDYKLHLANRMFFSKILKLDKSFKQFMSATGQNFPRKLNFKNNPKGSRRKINWWVSRNTDKIIKKFLKSNQVTDQTNVVFVNALLLKAKWLNQFSVTTQKTFMTSLRKVVKTDMMTGNVQCMLQEWHSRKWVQKLKSVGQFLIMKLPLQGENLVLSIVMPSSVNGLSSMQNEVNMKNLLEYICSIGENEVDYHGGCDVTMPKFELDFDYDLLKYHLINLGVRDAFSNSADFSGMFKTSGRPFYTPQLDDLAHKSVFRLDENGVNAASSGGGNNEAGSNVKLTINKPFLFFVHRNDAVLFAGRFVEPE